MNERDLRPQILSDELSLFELIEMVSCLACLRLPHPDGRALCAPLAPPQAALTAAGILDQSPESYVLKLWPSIQENDSQQRCAPRPRSLSSLRDLSAAGPAKRKQWTPKRSAERSTCYSARWTSKPLCFDCIGPSIMAIKRTCRSSVHFIDFTSLRPKRAIFLVQMHILPSPLPGYLAAL